jgi:hypothetical protein
MEIANGGYQFTWALARLRLGGASLSLRAPWPALLAVGSCAAYVALVAAAASTTWWRASAARLAKAHHAALCVYSAACFCAALFALVQSGEAADFAEWLASPAAGAARAPRLYCAPVPPWLRVVSLTFIASKVWEWGDTLALLAQGKSLREIGILHLYHHCTTVLCFLFTSSFPVTEKAGLLLNGLVHALMYFHFAFRLPRAARPLLTALQIAQLAAVTYAWNDCARLCGEAAAYKRDSPLAFWTPYATVPVYLLFFVKFFAEQYCCKATANDGDGSGGERKARRKHKVT